MSSPDINPSDRSDPQENSSASSRYMPVSRNGYLEIPPVDLIAVSRQEIAQIQEQHKQELARIREYYKQELERTEKLVTQSLERFARRIEAELSPRADYLRSLAGTLFGIAAGAACSIPQLETVPTLSSWVVPAFTISSIALCIISVILVFIDRNIRGTRKDSALSIAQEMRDFLGELPGGHRSGTA